MVLTYMILEEKYNVIDQKSKVTSRMEMLVELNHKMKIIFFAMCIRGGTYHEILLISGL